MLVTLNGELVVVEWVQHEILENPVAVYNFEVEDFHTYYVGNNGGVLVHNDCDAKKINPDHFETSRGLSKGTYHKKIKPKILSEVKPNYKVGKNPDILLNKKGDIFYQGAKGTGRQITGLNINNILKELFG